MPKNSGITKKVRILILGSHGMLGSALFSLLQKEYDVVAWDRDECDITSHPEVEEKISSLAPAIIINAAAYTDVDGAEENQAAAFSLNADAVAFLADISFHLNAAFIHYSTDYVFSGSDSHGHKETDIPGPPLNTYGLSKLKGEELLQAVTKKYSHPAWYLIRTSWLFGPNGKNFVKTIFNAAKTNKELKVVADQHGTPTYTKDLALATKNIIEGDFASGIYHITNETPPDGITWFEFAREIITRMRGNTAIVPISSTEVIRPASRPQYSMLINTKFPALRNWQAALEEYVEYLSLNSNSVER